MNVMGRMERNGGNLNMKHGLGEDDARSKHGVTEEIRSLAKLPGDGHKPSSKNFSFTTANRHST